MKDGSEKTPGTIDPVHNPVLARKRAQFEIELARELFVQNASPLVHDKPLQKQLCAACFKAAADFATALKESEPYKLLLLDSKFGLEEL